MIAQVNLQQRIVLKEDFQPNNSPLKLKIAFLNQEITADSKNGYFKLLIWLIGQNYVKDFDFKLFLKSENTQISIPVENLQKNFQPNNQNYLVVKIPSKDFNFNFDELTYTFLHDEIYAGQGRIFLNLKNDSKVQIDNELLFYENHQSFNLIERQLKWSWPEFYFNHHYSELLKMQFETLDYSSQINLVPVQQMAGLVRNNTWSSPLQFLELTLENEKDKRYDFKPQCEVFQSNNFFKLNFLNHLILNQKGLVVEGGDEKGLLLNPLVETQQLIKVKIKTFNLVKEITFWIHLPKLNLNSQFQGDWIEV